MTVQEKALVAAITAKARYLSMSNLERVEIRIDTLLEQEEKERALEKPPRKNNITILQEVGALNGNTQV